MKRNKGITLIALVITIIVLLILAGISIATLTGENGLLSKATIAKEEQKKEASLEKIKLATLASYGEDGKFNVETFKGEIARIGGSIVSEDLENGKIVVEVDGYEATINITTDSIESFGKNGTFQIEANLYQENGEPLADGILYDKVKIVVQVKSDAEIEKIDEIIVKSPNGIMEKQPDENNSYLVTESGTYTITVKATINGIQKEVSIEKEIETAPEEWITTSTTDAEWYHYGNAKINEPKITGQIKPIKYVGEEQSGNKWANAMTTDKSMWVWIPRYAYKITNGYHSNTAGTIEIAFITTNNQFLNGETGTITTNPSETGAGTTKWLVHPAFTSNAANGGGFGELEGLWIAKFEATGTSSNVTVQPGVMSLKFLDIKTQYKIAKQSSFGENVDLKSHMAKNSEWGVMVYLAHSKYGTNGQKIEKNSTWNTGGSTNKKTIYRTNKKQSTTHNATGIYDTNGCAWEQVANYVTGNNTNLEKYGGTASGDFYGATETERTTSTAYKTVQIGSSSQTQSNAYNTGSKYKGDAVYETSNSYSEGSNSAWFSSTSQFPYGLNPFILRGGINGADPSSSFCFMDHFGWGWNDTFRPVLAF